MGYAIIAEVESDEHRPARVKSLCLRFDGTLGQPQAGRFAPTPVKFDSWENFIKFCDHLIGRVTAVKEENHPHWVADHGGVPFWANSEQDEQQMFSIVPAHSAKEVSRFMCQFLVKRTLGLGDYPFNVESTIVKRLLND